MKGTMVMSRSVVAYAVSAALVLVALVSVSPRLGAVSAAGLTPTVLTPTYSDTLSQLCVPTGPAPAVAVPSAGVSLGVPLPGVSFEGLSVSAAFPNPNNTTETADDSAAAGLFHYVQVVNHGLLITDKTSRPLCAPIFTGAIWDNFLPPDGRDICASQDHLSDAVVIYDRQVHRWLIERPAGTVQCLAISATPDPTGAYYRYAYTFGSDGQYFLDYPKFGAGPDAYYSTADPGRIFSQLGIFATAYERDRLLVGDSTARAIYFLVPGWAQTSQGTSYFIHMLPADVDSPTSRPAGSPHPFVQFKSPTDPSNPPFSDALQVWGFSVSWDTTPSATFAPLTTLSPTPFQSVSCFESGCVEQPNTSQTLDSLGEYLMQRLAYRNFGSYQSLLWNQTINVTGDRSEFQAGITWFELRQPQGGAWTIYQQGGPANDANHRWAGSIAMDGAGNIALGYNISNATNLFPSIRYTGRQPNDDKGSLRPEVTLFAGAGSQTGYTDWADYSTMAVDPTDDCTFWYTNQYYPSTSATENWNTRIGAFRFPGCRPSAGSVTGWSSAAGTTGTGRVSVDVRRRTAGGPVTGQLLYVDPSAGVELSSANFVSLLVNGNTALLVGNGTNNGSPCAFAAMASDAGVRTGADTFFVSINAGAFTGGTLQKGNITIQE